MFLLFFIVGRLVDFTNSRVTFCQAVQLFDFNAELCLDFSKVFFLIS